MGAPGAPTMQMETTMAGYGGVVAGETVVLWGEEAGGRRRIEDAGGSARERSEQKAGAEQAEERSQRKRKRSTARSGLPIEARRVTGASQRAVCSLAEFGG